MINDPRTGILAQALSRAADGKGWDADRTLKELDLNDPMKNYIHDIWETEDEQLVVWGTHDMSVIQRLALTYYISEQELSQAEFEELNLSQMRLRDHGQFKWAHPSLRTEEIWPTFFISVTPKPTWVPFFVFKF